VRLSSGTHQTATRRYGDLTKRCVVPLRPCRREVHWDPTSKFTREEMQQVTTRLAEMWKNVSPQELTQCKMEADLCKEAGADRYSMRVQPRHPPRLRYLEPPFVKLNRIVRRGKQQYAPHVIQTQCRPWFVE